LIALQSFLSDKALSVKKTWLNVMFLGRGQRSGATWGLWRRKNDTDALLQWEIRQVYL